MDRHVAPSPQRGKRRAAAGEPHDGAQEAFFAAMEGPCLVQPHFEMEQGTQMRLGAGGFVGLGALFNDCATITPGDRVMGGKRAMFLASTRPLAPKERSRPGAPSRIPPLIPVTMAWPIVVERGVWLRAGALILPGVTICEGTGVGAGAMVTRSLPPRGVAVGNPARVIREIVTPEERETSAAA